MSRSSAAARFRGASRVLIAVAAALLAAGACGLGGTRPGSGEKLQVVAAENFWGSIAGQLGGDRVQVTSIVSNPAADPHDYEPTPQDARLIARANYVIENGAGYDPWVPKLLSANPVAGRKTLDIANLVGVKEGANPHIWYSPGYVEAVIDRMTADLKKLDPAGANYFDQQSSLYKTRGLQGYRDAVAAIKEKYSGTPVGASESIFGYLAQATGLDLVTPPGYMKAISAGADPSAADKAAVAQQVTDRKVKVFLFNSQNSTPEVQSVVARARTAGIPVVEMTETPSPPGLTFQDWQTRQLKSLLAALGG